MRLLAGIEAPTEGQLYINGCEMTREVEGLMGRKVVPSWMNVGLLLAPAGVPQPVLLDGKPDFDNTRTVMEWIVQVGIDSVEHHCKNSVGQEQMDSTATAALIRSLAQDFASLLQLPTNRCSSVPLDLSPSEQYLFGIACGCMVSVSPIIASMPLESASLDETTSIPYPIILFDELFDTEYSGTVEKCNRGILNLIEHGAVVVSATHRPEYFGSMSSRVITLSGGNVLTVERLML